LAARRRQVAVGCRIIAHAGLAEDVLGHISVRLDGGTILVRSRGPAECGLLFTTPADVRAVDLDGRPLGDTDGYQLPNELPIHLACYRADPDVEAVVHAHPPSVIAADLASVALTPMIGAYNIPAAKLAAEGIPVFPRGVLINTAALAGEMIDAMAGRPVCVLRGHGVTTTGATVPEAVARALAVDSLARMACRVASLGAVPKGLADEDLRQLPDLGSAFNDELLWRHHERRLAEAGLALPAD
jgi:3,4-dihydroxyphthalate decarboxylase